jgi:hypothetical protein
MSHKVTVAATIDALDYGIFGPNERSHAESTRETVLNSSKPQNVMDMQLMWGGECRVEFRLTGQIQDDSSVRCTGEALLFEGTSETTGDLDNRRDFAFIVPKGKTISNHQRVNNDDEGDDCADIRMTVTNIIVEEE